MVLEFLLFEAEGIGREGEFDKVDNNTRLVEGIQKGEVAMPGIRQAGEEKRP